MPDMRDVVIFNQRFYTNVYNVVNIYLLSFIYLIFHGLLFYLQINLIDLYVSDLRLFLLNLYLA